MNKNFFYLILLLGALTGGYLFLFKKGYIKTGACCDHSHTHHDDLPAPEALSTPATTTAALHEIKTVEELDTLLTSTDPVLIKVFAPWCSPCKEADKVFPEIMSEFPHVRFYSLNITPGDNKPSLALELHKKGVVENPISSIPSFIYIKNGKAIKVLQGFKDKNDLIERLKAIL